MIEKKSPVDGARFWSLSRTMTSKRHSGDVVVSRVGHVDGKPDGAEDVRSVAAQEDQLVPAGRGGFSPMQICGFQLRVDLVDDPVDPERRAERVTALVVVGELDAELPGWRI